MMNRLKSISAEKRHKYLTFFTVLIPVWMLTGCGLSPSIPVFGAAFPSWFFCALAAAMLLIPTHLILTKLRLLSAFAPLVISYLGLMFIYSVLFWLIFFAG